MRGTFKYLYGLATLAFAAPYVDPQTFGPGQVSATQEPAAILVQADALLPVEEAWNEIRAFDSRRLVSSISEPNELTARLGIRVPTLGTVNDAWAGLAHYSQLSPQDTNWGGVSDPSLQNKVFDASDAAARGFVDAYSGF